jgi:hypothetical protein
MIGRMGRLFGRKGGRKSRKGRAPAGEAAEAAPAPVPPTPVTPAPVMPAPVMPAPVMPAATLMPAVEDALPRSAAAARSAAPDDPAPPFALPFSAAADETADLGARRGAAVTPSPLPGASRLEPQFPRVPAGALPAAALPAAPAGAPGDGRLDEAAPASAASAPDPAPVLAYRLLLRVMAAQGMPLSVTGEAPRRIARRVILDTYSDCLNAVRGAAR